MQKKFNKQSHNSRSQPIFIRLFFIENLIKKDKTKNINKIFIYFRIKTKPFRDTYKRVKNISFPAKSGNKMTEEPKKIEKPIPEKLLIDDPNNFLFHAAYNTYSELFDSAISNEAKQDLNNNITSLKENKIDRSTFYFNITRHRSIGRDNRRGRFTLNTQRKRDWRKKSQRQDRIKRHKK
jgi:hypothetical protein